MRSLICAVLSASLSASILLIPTLSHAEFIEISKPKPKKKAAPVVVAPKEEDTPKKKGGQHYEMRIHLSESQVSRDLAPLIVKRMSEYGYGMAPEVFYGDLYRKAENNGDEDAPKPAVFEHTFSFEIVKSENSCFVVTKVVGEDVRQILSRWETKGAGELSCELQVQQAMKDYAAKNPPKSPAKNFDAIEAGFLAEVQKSEAEIAAKHEAEKKAAEAAEAERKAKAEAFRAQQAEAEKALMEQQNFNDYGKGGMGCSASGTAASLPALLSLLGAVLPLRRRRS